MCSNVKWHANELANALQTPNQCSRAPTKKDGNPVEAGLMVRRNDSPGSSLHIKSHVSSHAPNLNNKVQHVNYS